MGIIILTALGVGILFICSITSMQERYDDQCRKAEGNILTRIAEIKHDGTYRELMCKKGLLSYEEEEEVFSAEGRNTVVREEIYSGHFWHDIYKKKTGITQSGAPANNYIFTWKGYDAKA